MKRVIGKILVALGVLMLVLAPLVKFYVLRPSPAKVPVDQYSESQSDVVFELLLDPAALAEGDPDPYKRGVEATQYAFVRGDASASDQPEAKSQDLAIVDYFERINDNDTEELIDASKARFAFDRASSELVDCCGASVNDEPVNMGGSIVPVKFPFDVQQQDYQVFNTRLQAGTTFTYAGQEEKFGMNTFVFKNEVTPTKVGTLQVPTSLVPGEDEEAGGSTVLDEMYSVVNTYWIEPVTGQIVAGESAEDSTFELNGETKLIKAKYTVTSGTQDGADDIAAQAAPVRLLGWVSALVLGFLGVTLVLVGLLLLLRGGKQDAGASASSSGS